jgi:hypothetical protein
MGISPVRDKLPTDEKKLLTWLQETFPGFLNHTNAQIERLLTALTDMQHGPHDYNRRL